MLGGVSVALGAVILAPIALSSQDLYEWGKAPLGLGLDGWWPFLVPAALDLAAAACIGMTIVSAWRRERAGVFSALVWVFALVSAYAQFSHGIAEKEAGRALDAYWAMPLFAVLGPVLLHAVLSRIRRWKRKDTGELHQGAAGFGERWMVAPRETLSAWAASRREGIAVAADAISYVRERKALAQLDQVDALRYAWGALGTEDTHAARVWLAARGVVVDQDAIDTATGAPAPAVPQVSAPAKPQTKPVAAAPKAEAKRPAPQVNGADRPKQPLRTLDKNLQLLRDQFPGREPSHRQVFDALGITSKSTSGALKKLIRAELANGRESETADDQERSA